MCLMLADDSAFQVYLVGCTLPRRVHFRGTNKVQLGYSAGVPIVIPHRTRLLGSNPSYATGTVPQAKYGITSKSSLWWQPVSTLVSVRKACWERHSLRPRRSMLLVPAHNRSSGSSFPFQRSLHPSLFPHSRPAYKKTCKEYGTPLFAYF